MPIALFFSSRHISAHLIRNFRSSQSTSGRFNIGLCQGTNSNVEQLRLTGDHVRFLKPKRKFIPKKEVIFQNLPCLLGPGLKRFFLIMSARIFLQPSFSSIKHITGSVQTVNVFFYIFLSTQMQINKQN